jgi:hypothetical protein
MPTPLCLALMQSKLEFKLLSTLQERVGPRSQSQGHIGEIVCVKNIL